jgi:Ni/Co efflux regulator RcnB
MRKQVITLISLVVVMALTTPVAVAKNDKHKGHKEKPQHAQQKQAHNQGKPEREPRFSSHEHDLIQDYYYRHRYDSGRSKLPKGLQKKYERTGELPPGWQKKVQRGEILPIDIYNSAGDIPFELREQLPVGPVGSEIIKLESKIIRVMEGTRMILDVFDIGR